MSIVPSGTVSLGQPFDERGELARELAPGILLLEGGAEDARSVAVLLDETGVVMGLLLEHESGESFSQRVERHTQNHGEPLRIDTVPELDGPLTLVRCARWADARTRFEVGLVRAGGTDYTASLLTDGSVAQPNTCALARALAEVVAATGARSNKELYSPWLATWRVG